MRRRIYRGRRTDSTPLADASMFVTVILIAALLVLLLTYLFTLKSRYAYFSRRNIPGPPPQLLFGHALELSKARLSTDQIYQWTRQYGPIYGVFEGTQPIYIVSDVDFVQEVYIKQFSSFHSRYLNFFHQMQQSHGSHLFFALGDEWRRQRHIMNPTFTTMKLKTMSPLITQCIASMLSKLEQKQNTEFDIFTLYQRLTMDVICKKFIFTSGNVFTRIV